MSEDKLKRLEDLLNLANDGLSKAEFDRAFQTVVDMVLKLGETLKEDINSKIPGKNGKDGRDGRDGRDGVDGRDGAPGPKGEPGDTIIGPAGRDGSPDTADVIRNKLELLPDGEKLKIEAIEGLREELDNTSAAIKKGMGSGGTGAFGSVGHSPLSESFTMNGSDTSVTLSQGVTAGGNAIIVRMQGQVLDPTTHYTVNGNKVSFTYTPSNGTTISCLYWP